MLMAMLAVMVVLRLLRAKGRISSRSASLTWVFVACLGYVSLIMFGVGTAQQKTIGLAAFSILFAVYYRYCVPRDGSRSS